MALLEAISNKKHPAGCLAPGVDEGQDEDEGQNEAEGQGEG